MNPIELAKGIGSNARAFAQAKKPELLLLGGLALIGGGVAMTIHGTIKALKHHDERISDECDVFDQEIVFPEDENVGYTEKELEEIHEDGLLTEIEGGRKIIGIRLRYALKVAADYAPAVALLGSGVACVILSHNTQAKRLALVTAAYNTALATFNEYRQNVIEAQGAEFDQTMLGKTVEAMQAIESRKDANGQVMSQSEALKAIGIDPSQDYHRVLFDETTSYEFDQNGTYNAQKLKCLENWATNKLQATGWLLVSEVLQNLGIDPSQYPMSFICGWVYDGTPGSDVVDFGLWNVGNEENWNNPHPNGWWLNFNDQGIILPYLELVRR